MSKNPVLPLYYNDLICSTKTWTDEEFGAYVRLLIEQWDKGSIPNDMRRLSRIADSVNLNWSVLCQKFTPGEDGNLRNSVMEDVRNKKERFSEHQRENVLKRYQTSTKPSTKVVTKTTPLEDEIEKEKEIELEKEIVFPFTSEFFQASWGKWKDYRQTEHRKKFKSIQAEQSSLSHLETISEKNEFEAIKIIERSIANQWQGLFEIKKENNGSSKQQAQANARALAIEIGKREFAALREANLRG